MTPNLKLLKKETQKLSHIDKAQHSMRFFKTGEGEYGANDKFLGLTVPESRIIAKKFANHSLNEVYELLQSEFHEERLIALIILINLYDKGDDKTKKDIFDIYIKNTKYINNWDLVDTSAGYIVGGFLDGKDKSIIYKLAKSSDLWERRISIISTFYYIYKGESELTLQIAEILKDDKHDLIQKAVGWMLREVGKRCSESIEEEFLKKHYKTMPRTMLRYAIERFPENKRKAYLQGKI